MKKKTRTEKLQDARKAAAVALQKLCFDAHHDDMTTFMNRDRGMEVVDKIVVAVLATLDAYLEESKEEEDSHVA
jgi:hypothetical protein